MTENTNILTFEPLLERVMPANDERQTRPSTPLLSASDELELAQSIEKADISTWQALLSRRTMVEQFLDLVAKNVEISARDLAALRRAHTIAAATPTARNQAALARAARKTAERLVALDADHRCRELALHFVDQVAANDEVASDLAEVRKAARRAMRLRHVFVQANLRLVLYIATRYRASGVPLADLVQEGNMGLMKAVDRFDYRRGLRFSTYASYWIRQMITRAIANDGRTVRVPVHVQDTHQKLSRIWRELCGQLGRTPTLAELAESSEIPEDKIAEIRESLGGHNVSLDQSSFEDSDAPKIDSFLSIESQYDTPERLLFQQVDAVSVRDSLAVLTEQQADILRKRFALDEDRRWTLQEIADTYGLTRERIRQIEKASLQILRKHLDTERSAS